MMLTTSKYLKIYQDHKDRMDNTLVFDCFCPFDIYKKYHKFVHFGSYVITNKNYPLLNNR